MNTNAGLLPCDFEIEDINVAQKYSDLCEATCKNIMGYSPYELTIDSEEFLEFQILANKLLDNLSKDLGLSEMQRLCKKLKSVYYRLMSSCWQAFLCNPSIEGEAGRFIVNQMWSVSEFNKSLLPIKRLLHPRLCTVVLASNISIHPHPHFSLSLLQEVPRLVLCELTQNRLLPIDDGIGD